MFSILYFTVVMGREIVEKICWTLLFLKNGPQYLNIVCEIFDPRKRRRIKGRLYLLPL